MHRPRTPSLATLLLLVCGGCDPATTPAPPAPPATRVATPATPGVDTLLTQLTAADAAKRVDACAALIDYGAEPAVVPALYLRLADEDETPEVKLAAVQALATIGDATARKMLHGYFFGRPTPIEAWMLAGDWLVDEVGAETIARDLSTMSNREDYDLVLVRTFAARHRDEPALRALYERLQPRRRGGEEAPPDGD